MEIFPPVDVARVEQGLGTVADNLPTIPFKSKDEVEKAYLEACEKAKKILAKKGVFLHD